MLGLICAFLLAPPGCVVQRDSVWHESHLLRDLTADARADSLSLRVTGNSVDSLTVIFRIHADGKLLYSQEWKSRWYFHYPSPAPSDHWTPELKLAELRSQFSTFFAASRFVPTVTYVGVRPDTEVQRRVQQHLASGAAMDSLLLAGVRRDSAEMLARPGRADTTEARITWSAIRTVNPLAFRFYMGEERTVVVAWDPRTRRFIPIDSCCQ